MLCNTALTVSSYIFIKKSYTGYRPDHVPIGAVNKVTTAKLRYINSVTYHPTLNLIKISFLVTLIRLQSPNKWIRRSLWFLLAITVMFAISITVTGIMSCLPIERFWDRTVPGSCRDSEQYLLAGVSTTIITDVLVTFIPTWILYSIQMPWKTKAVVLCFMSLGLFVTAITAYRLAYFVRLYQIADPVRNETTYNIRTPLSNLEVNLSAIASCGPIIKWLLGRCIPFFDTQRKRPSDYHYSENIPSNSNTRRSSLEPTMVGETTAGGGDNIDVELNDQVVWKRKGDNPTDARSEEHQILGDEGNEGIAGRGTYVKYNATKPVDIV
ncbi:hypothetical protein DM02DRAFT_511771 [Periconia macrospinosa]|uniref:Rhodopsin domain-containing protein n=1 Tax=Periconia macrospinosa TaxID=97972 RepID=A0A2V1EBM5_9PLEO|nr:hypothetical protein DM02DRAFT_511771 [Periconia macrospinosa]